jgi:hypothetical protein
MGGTFTQKRKVIPQEDRIYIRRSNLNVVNSTWGVFDTTQETTSYRTSGADLEISKFTRIRQPRFRTEDLFDFTYMRGERYDTGHPFYTFKKETSWSHPYINISGRNGTRYRGCLVPSRTAFGLANGYMEPANNSLTTLGTVAINATRPNNSIASVAQTLAELKREGLPNLSPQLFSDLLRHKTSIFRSLGGAYLNVQFGWKPLVNDVVKVLTAVTQVPKVLEQLQKDSGQQVRRKFHFEDTTTTTSDSVFISGVVVTTAHNTNDNNRLFKEKVTGDPTNVYNSGWLLKTETEKVSSWFSGAYTYYFETDEDLFGKARMYAQLAEKLLGIRITPEVLWELAPWSWLADWFANFGQLISNVSGFMSDGLVMRYGYMMQTVVRTRTLTQTGVAFEGGSVMPYSVSYVTTSKKREKATPFGFGLNPVNFTNRQWAILAALALAKAPRSLY